MSNVYAVKSGNWSDPTVWNTGSLPTVNDLVWANTYTVQVDMSPTVQGIRNGATTGVTAGGGFVANAGYTLTCTTTDGIIGSSAATPCLSSSLASPNNFTYIGSSNNAVANNANAIYYSGTGTLNITGTINSAYNGAININGTGTVNITGDITGTAQTMFINAASVVRITGSVYATVGAVGNTIVLISNNISLYITGNVSTGTSGAGIIMNSGSGLALDIVGTITSNSVVSAVNINNGGGTCTLSGPMVNTSGKMAILADKIFLKAGYESSWKFTTSTGVDKTLFTAGYVGGNPSPSDVRHGTVYGIGGGATGTAYIPAAASVAYGVPVDATTGTAVLNQTSLENVIGPLLAAYNL